MTAVAEEDIPVCAPPDPAPRAPEFGFPPLACDCHAHICGPQAIYKYIPERIYSPPDALLADYQRLLRTLGCERAVLAQPSFYGTDNSAMLAASGRPRLSRRRGHRRRRQRARTRGDACGGRSRRAIKHRRSARRQGAIADRAHRAAGRPHHGWHIEFLMHVDAFPDLDRMLERLPVDVVFGHLGYVRTEKGTAVPGFQALLRLLRGGRAWVQVDRSLPDFVADAAACGHR
jgi:predicted TIM-barrel fold metal-dependent hydrolase